MDTLIVTREKERNQQSKKEEIKIGLNLKVET